MFSIYIFLSVFITFSSLYDKTSTSKLILDLFHNRDIGKITLNPNPWLQNAWNKFPDNAHRRMYWSTQRLKTTSAGPAAVSSADCQTPLRAYRLLSKNPSRSATNFKIWNLSLKCLPRFHGSFLVLLSFGHEFLRFQSPQRILRWLKVN